MADYTEEKRYRMSTQRLVVLGLFLLSVAVDTAIRRSAMPLLEGKSPVQIFFAAWLWCMFYNGIR